MEALVGAIIDNLVSTACDYCFSLLRREGIELCLPRPVSSMRQDLEYIRDGIKEAHRSILHKAWLSELTCYANQFEDSIDLYECSLTKTKDARKRLEKEIEAIIKKIEQTKDDLSKRSSEATTTSNPAQGHKGRPDHSQSKTNEDLYDQVGMEEAFKKLREVLLQPNSKMNLICIVGFAGIGKTFLAKELYNSVHEDFPRQAWVSASGKEDAEAIIMEIKELLKLDEIKGVDDDRCKRSLVVIDDVRKRELLDMDGITEGLPPGSRIIVTTTRQSVANNMRSGDLVYRMKTLDGANPENLFFQVASSCGEDYYSEAHKAATRSVIDICDGLPLALVSTAQFLKHKVQGYRMEASDIQEKCKEALEACRTCVSSGPGSEDKLRRMKQVLLDNYHDLDGYVIKDCLLYLCMFPRGHPVKTSSLARRWMAEGLVEERDGVDVAEVANRNLNILIDRNIIQPIDEDVKKCQLPVAIMLEYISHQSNSEGFMRAVPSPQEDMPEYVRRLSVHNYDGRNMEGTQFPFLRTLAVFRRKVGGATDDAVGFKAKFSDYKLLRVLDLEECNGLDNSHLEDICKTPPPLLKYLSLGGSITEVPSKIKKIKCLQTLDLRKCCKPNNKIVQVPVEVFLLPKLKHLLGMFCLSGVEKKIPDELSDTCQLETLSGFVADNRDRICSLMNYMKRLSKVKIQCESTIRNEASEAIEKFLRNEHNTPVEVKRSLSIDSTNGCSKVHLLEKEADTISYLLPTSTLYSLKLKGNLNRFPPFVSKVGGITKLCLRSTGLKGDDIIPSIQGLAILTHLKLVEEGLVKLAIGKDCLQSLERLCLVCKEGNLPYIEIESGALDSIISISLHLLRDPRSDIKIDNHRPDWENQAKQHRKRPNLFIEQLTL